MTRNQTGVQVARGLRNSEHALDDAIAQTMRLGAEMLEGRKTARLAASVGQKALTDVIAGLGAMAAARDALISAHGELLQVADDHCVPWRLDGPTETKPAHPTGMLPAAANAA